ncbi:Atp13a5, partial [Symbiodinium sp. KB8]
MPDGLKDENAHLGLIVSFRETPCLVIYCYVAAALALYSFWCVRRSIRNAITLSAGTERTNGTPKSDKPWRQDACRQCVTDSQNRVIEFEGYKPSRLGRFASMLVPMTTALLVILFVVAVADYYWDCEWSWPDHLCFIGTFPIFGSFDTNSYVFLIVWCLGVTWFFFLIVNTGGQMIKQFGLRAPFRKAAVICVSVQERQETISSGYSRTLALRKKVLGLVAKLLRAKDLPGGFLSLSGASSQTIPLKYDHSSKLWYVEFRCQRYVYDPVTDGFLQHDPSTSLRKGHAAFDALLAEGGLRTKGPSPQGFKSVEEMYRSSGPNRIPFEVDGWTQALTEEFSTLFFLYQFAIYAVCVWFSYWHYTIIAMTIAVISGFFNTSVRLASQQSIKSMMEQQLTAHVLRDGQVVEVDANELVPGDILKVHPGPVPCDLLLLRGAAVCDESTLTGESMPVQRLAPVEKLPDDPPGFRFPAKHSLVAGTSVLQVVDDETWALATHTGIHTQKGQLLLLILYPPKLVFKYDEQLSVVFFLLIIYAFALVVKLMRVMYVRYAVQQKLPLTATWASGVFTCSCVLPTMLHIVLSVGQVISAKRLKEKACSIFCVVPKRIALAGKVRVACFDKTGTLTTSGLEFFGVHCVEMDGTDPGLQGSQSPFSSPLAAATATSPRLAAEPQKSKWDLHILCGLASAHSLSPFSQSEAGVVGNAVEVNMFKASGWSLASQRDVRSPSGGSFEGHRLEILKRFDFSHSTMTMSAVVKHHPSGEQGIYCKGSFEHILRKCRPSSVPENFVQ